MGGKICLLAKKLWREDVEEHEILKISPPNKMNWCITGKPTKKNVLNHCVKQGNKTIIYPNYRPAIATAIENVGQKIYLGQFSISYTGTPSQ